MASDAMLELILFVREHGWRLESYHDEASTAGGHDKFVVTAATSAGAPSDDGAEEDDFEGEEVCVLVGGGFAMCEPAVIA